MGKIFQNEDMQYFMEHTYQSCNSMDQLILQLEKGIAPVASRIRLGYVELRFELTKESVSWQTLYDAGVHANTPVHEETIDTTDGGLTNFSFYPLPGHVWEPDEIEVLSFMAKQLYMCVHQILLQERLSKTMVTDLLTGIPNQASFFTYASKLFAQNLLPSYDAFFFNVRNFRYVNSVLPYAEGSIVLRNYANQLLTFVKNHGIVARLGGDNFVCLIEKKCSDRFLKQLSHVRLSHTWNQQTRDFVFSASIGGSHLENIHEVNEIMFQISTACGIAKQSGLYAVVYYDQEILERFMHDKEIVSNFYSALKQKEFEVYYQPKVLANTRSICGAEALIRWKKDGHMIPPAEFIPVLERNGSICELDFYVLESVCQLLSRRIKNGQSLVQISVNFSRKHLMDANFVSRLIKIVDAYRIPHEYIEAELTESENFQDFEIMSRVLNDLRQHGIRTSLDDFGTGYSSLKMLRNSKVDVIKIDRSFMPDTSVEEAKKRDTFMLNNIVHIARDLGMEIVAEGVETPQQLEYLKDLNCDVIQGFLFDAPLPAEQFEQRLIMGNYEISELKQ